MGDRIWPPLPPHLRESVMLYRNGVQLLRTVQAQIHQTGEAIQLLRWWLNYGDLDPLNKDGVEDILPRFEADLTLNSLGQQSLHQRLRVEGDILFNWVMESPLVRNPRDAILCRTLRDIEAVHTLSQLRVWPRRHLFRVGIDWTLPNNPVPPQRLADYALYLDCEIYSIDY